MRTSLRTRILWVTAIVAILPSLTVGVLAIRRAQSDVEREVVRGHLAQIRALGSALDETLHGAHRSLALTASWWADTAAAGQPDPAITERVVRRLRREVPLIADVSFLDVNGRTIAGPNAELGADAADTYGGFVGDVQFGAEGPSVLLVAQARSRTGELVGILAARLNLEFVARALEDARLSRGSELLVVDGAGVPIAQSTGEPPRPHSLRGKHPAVDLALASATEGTTAVDGSLYAYRNLSSFETLRGVRWALVLMQPEAEAFALARATTRDTIITVSIAMILAVVLGGLLARRVTRPLQSLAAHADTIAGDSAATGSSKPLALDAPGEIGTLAHRMEEMEQRIGERERLQTSLAHADRLSTVGILAASVAHEINNPLTTVVGYSNLLLEDKEDDHPDQAGLKLIASESQRMQNIVSTLLHYSRADERGLGPVSPAQVWRRCAALLSPAFARANVALEAEIAGDLPDVAASDQSLLQVLINLVQNALHASTSGAAVRVRARRRANAVAIAIEDEGPGVSEEDRETIFLPFHTSKPAGSGTGLGLAVAKHLAHEMHASIELAPGNTRGACFTVVLPIAESDGKDPDH